MQKSKIAYKRMEELFKNNTASCVYQTWKKSIKFFRPRKIIFNRSHGRLSKCISGDTLGSSSESIIERVDVHKISEKEWGEDSVTEESKNKNIYDP